MLKNVCIVFVGAPDKWIPFEKVERDKGWRVQLAKWPKEVFDIFLQNEPDLVIIDDFPESKVARSVFFKLRAAEKIPFLVLNDSPGDIRFSRLYGLSFIHMLKRNPDPADLVNTVNRLIELYHKSQ